MTKRLIKSAIRNLRSFKEMLRLKNLYTKEHSIVDPEIHIREAASWLCRAQDHGTDRGVSYGARFGDDFLPSYPETTGYIIPTFIRLSQHYSDKTYLERAIEMADWEIQIQMPSGAVMGGMVSEKPTAAIFNTGQVILGWNSLYEHTGERRFLDASVRAGDWLLTQQEPDGNWIKGNSQYARSDSTVYNVRAAWGLAQLGKIADRSDYAAAALRNAEFALSHQSENGWFSACCLDDPEHPLTHTLAYTVRGLLEIGLLSSRNDLVEAAEKTARGVARCIQEDGCLPGRFDSRLRPAAKYVCMTGTAQFSGIWLKFYKMTKASLHRSAALKANQYLMKRHDLASPFPTIRGGVPGSWPVSGQYGRFKILNWAVKFFVDALLDQVEAEAESGK